MMRNVIRDFVAAFLNLHQKIAGACGIKLRYSYWRSALFKRMAREAHGKDGST